MATTMKRKIYKWRGCLLTAPKERKKENLKILAVGQPPLPQNKKKEINEKAKTLCL